MTSNPLSALKDILGVSPKEAWRRFNLLTKGETDIAESLASGLTATEIGENRGTSNKTVHVQMAGAKRKLQARHFIDVVRIVYAAKAYEALVLKSAK